MNTSILILGAKSSIGLEIAKKYAKEGFSLFLAGREIYSLNSFAEELKTEFNTSIKLIEFNIENFDSHKEFYESLNIKLDGVILVAGYMPNQKESQVTFSESLRTINVNFSGPVSILNIVASDFEKRKNGFIVAISSVAGDRGRKTNYMYGSSKAGLSTYLSGLRNRLFSSNVSVLTVKPGFVLTKMTSSMNLPPLLSAHAKDVAIDIYKAQQNKSNILYTKYVWKYIMFIIKVIPEFIFKRLSI